MSADATQRFVLYCLIFSGVLLATASRTDMIYVDSDTAWHLAAGDLIRSLGHVPALNTWSWTAPDAPWINLAWLWDVTMSLLHEHLGWHGQVAFISLCVAGTVLLLFYACLLKGATATAGFMAVALFLVSCALHLRSLWISNVFLAVLFAMALAVARGRSPRWWYVMPVLMPLWVNMHGGFIVGFFLLGAFGLQALTRKEWHALAHMVCAGLLSILAFAATPYAFSDVVRIVGNTFTTPALSYLSEFAPSELSWVFAGSHLYALLFIAFAIHQRTRIPLADAIVIFTCLLLSLMSVRYWNFFYLFSCPQMAIYFSHYLQRSARGARPNPTAQRIADHLHRWFFIRHARATMFACAVMAAGASAFLFSPAGRTAYGMEDFVYANEMQGAAEYTQAHLPNHRFFTEYNLGGPLILHYRGNFPVFIDGRGETAYPRALVEAYGEILRSADQTEEILERYGVNAALVSSYNPDPIGEHLAASPRWRLAYSDRTASVYVRK